MGLQVFGIATESPFGGVHNKLPPKCEYRLDDIAVLLQKVAQTVFFDSRIESRRIKDSGRGAGPQVHGFLHFGFRKLQY